MAEQPIGMTCILQLDTDIPGWHLAMTKLFKSIQDVSYSIDTQTKFAYVSGEIDKELLLKLLAKAKTHAFTHQINYGISLPKHTSEPTMTCVLLVDTDIPGWHKAMRLLFKPMQGVTFTINAFTRQAYISGKISPVLQLKLLAKAEANGARLCWLYYGCEHDPSFLAKRRTFSVMDYPAEDMNCVLRVDTRFLGWRVMLVRVLDSIDGITYKIDGEKGIVQITGRINPRQLMKTLAEVGLHADFSRVRSQFGETNIPSRHCYDYRYYGGYGYNPYVKPEYYYGYPPLQQRNWHPIYENYPHYLHYNQNQPVYEPQAEYFPQPPPQPDSFRNGDPEWCTIM
ncbi:hypothetical protein PVK06_000961 [Gossypium arboreum]|uniref:HMA domain-containing protein n=2 Tax=Gossypium arboreum TaxID=29729 RepID=A0ABR0QZY3_GOSAR|nr:hypothetical protein PVK06_000961 [Gossypium arboreum]